MKIVITGASRGIGKGIARVLHRRGHAVGLLSRSEETLMAVRDALRNGGDAPCEAVCCDVGVWDQVAAAVARLDEALGGIDALVNNAGRIIRKPADQLALTEWREMMAANVDGVFHMTRAILPVLFRRGGGHIVNVSSISGRLPLAGGSGYAASKYAVTGFSESLFHEVRERNVKVTVVYPGSVDVTFGAEPANRWKVQPEDVGEACAAALEASAQTCIHHLEVRPLGRPASG